MVGHSPIIHKQNHPPPMCQPPLTHSQGFSTTTVQSVSHHSHIEPATTPATTRAPANKPNPAHTHPASPPMCQPSLTHNDLERARRHGRSPKKPATTTIPQTPNTTTTIPNHQSASHHSHITGIQHHRRPMCQPPLTHSHPSETTPKPDPSKQANSTSAHTTNAPNATAGTHT